MSRGVKITAAIAVILLLGAGFYWWAALRDTSDPTASLDAMSVSAGSQLPAAGSAATPDGTWAIQQGADVWVGYRVNETILPARTQRTVNGRSPAVTGTLTISDGTVKEASLTIDVTKLASDLSVRDQVLQNIGLETAKFPEATFKLREPVPLPSGLTEGTAVELTLKGTLTAHGVDHELDIAVQAKWDGSTIVVASTGEGAAFAMVDYGIALPAVPIVEGYEKGTLEAQLRFAKQ